MAPLVRKTGLVDASRNTQVNFKKSNIQEGVEGVVENAYRDDVKGLKEAQDPYLAKLETTMFNETLTMADAGTKQLYEVNKEDPKKFQEESYKQAKEYAKTFEGDEGAQSEFLARYNISQKPYQVKVQNNFKKKEEKKYKATERAVMDSTGQSLKDNSVLFYTKGEGYDDINYSVNSAYNKRNATDSNGNDIYTKSQITKIEKAYDDRFFNGAKAYVDDNVYVDDNAIISMKNEIMTDKQSFMKKKNLNSKEANDLIKYISGYETAQKQARKTAEKTELSQEEEEALVNNAITLQTMFDDIGITKDKKTGKTGVKNADYKNVNSIIDFRSKADALYKAGGLKDAKYITYKSDSARALMNMVEQENTGFEGEQWFEKPTSGRMAGMINKKLEKSNDIDRAMIFESAYKTMMEQEISPDSSNTQDKRKVDKITQDAIISYLGDVEPAMAYTMARDNSEYGSFMTRDSVVDFFTPKDADMQKLSLDPNGFVLPNGGYKIEWKNGKLMTVLKDSNGVILDESEAL